MDSRLDLDNPRLFLDLLQMRKDRQKDSIIIVTGERRNGKSFGAIRLAEHLQKDFDVEKNLFFNVKDFLVRWNTLDGGVIILDEASENVDRRNWFSIENRVFNSLITREGYRRNVAILTFPTVSDLDTRSIRLCSHHVCMKGINQEKKEAFAVVYRLKQIQELGKTYRAFIQVVPFGLPSEQNITKYMKMKIDWNAVKSKENIDIMDMLEDPDSYKKKLPYTFYINAYRQGIIDEVDVKDHLKAIGIKENDIYLLLESEIKKKEDIIKKQDDKESKQDDLKRPAVESRQFVSLDTSLVKY